MHFDKMWPRRNGILKGIYSNDISSILIQIFTEKQTDNISTLFSAMLWAHYAKNIPQINID